MALEIAASVHSRFVDSHRATPTGLGNQNVATEVALETLVPYGAISH
jgi:hypothetical protein